MNETLNETLNQTAQNLSVGAGQQVTQAAQGGFEVTGIIHNLMNNVLTDSVANLLNGFLHTNFFTGELVLALTILLTLFTKWHMVANFLGQLGNYAILILAAILILGRLTSVGWF